MTCATGKLGQAGFDRLLGDAGFGQDAGSRYKQPGFVSDT